MLLCCNGPTDGPVIKGFVDTEDSNKKGFGRLSLAVVHESVSHRGRFESRLLISIVGYKDGGNDRQPLTTLVCIAGRNEVLPSFHRGKVTYS